MIEERRYRGGSRGRSASPRRAPMRSRDNSPRSWRQSSYQRRGREKYAGEAKPSREIEKRDGLDDRVSRLSDYNGRDRDRYDDGGRRFRSPVRVEKFYYDRHVVPDYGDGAKSKYDNEVAVGGLRRSYNVDSYRGNSSSVKIGLDKPLDGSRKSDHLSLKDYGQTRGSSDVGYTNVTRSSDKDYYLQSLYSDSSRSGLPASQYLDSTVPASLKYENRGKMHSDSYTLARGVVVDLPVSNLSGIDGGRRGVVDDLPVSNLSGIDGGRRLSYLPSDYSDSDANRNQYLYSRDEPHLERRDGSNDRQDRYLKKKMDGFDFHDRYLGVAKTVESKLYKLKEEDNLLSSRGYMKGDSDYMVSTSQHKDYSPVPSSISREGFSGYSPKRGLHLPTSDVSQRGSTLASQPIRFDGYSEKKENTSLLEPSGQLDNKRRISHLYDGLTEDRHGDWPYVKFGRSKIDSISTRVIDAEEDYRDQHISRTDVLKHTIDARTHKDHMEDDALWNHYPSSRVQSTSDKLDAHGSLSVRRADLDSLGTGSTCLNYGAEGYYGYRGVEAEKNHTVTDGRQCSYYENSDILSGEYDSMSSSPEKKRLPMVDSSFAESYERRLQEKHVRDELLYDHDIRIRISADGNGARRIYNQVDAEDEIDFLHFSKKPKSSRLDYKKTWRMSNRLGSGEPSSSKCHPYHPMQPQKSNSRDIKMRLGPTQKLHVSQRLVKKYKPSIKKRLAPPPSKKHATLPWMKNASSSTMTSEQGNPDRGVHNHDGKHLVDRISVAKPEPSEKSEEFKQLVQSAFFKFLKQFNETPIKRMKFTEQGKAGILKCFVCGSNSEEFVGTKSLAIHAFTSNTLGMRSQHLGMHKALCALMGWKPPEHPSSEWHCEVMTDAETRVLKEDLIIWPPLVVVHNSSIDSTSPGERVIVSAEKLDAKLKDMGFKSVLKVCNGKPANQSVMLVKFNATLSGLQEALRFHKNYIKSKHSRAEFERLNSTPGSSSAEKKVASSDNEYELFYGYLGTTEDLDKLDFDTKKRCVLRSKKQILSVVDAPINGR